MKKLFFIPAILFLALPFCYSQENKVILIEEWVYDEEKDKMILDRKTSYDYDENDLVILVEEWRYDEEEDRVVLGGKTSYDYEENNLVILSESWAWSEETEAFWKNGTTDYEYSGAGDLVKETDITFDENGDIEKTLLFEYSYYANGCIKQYQRSGIYAPWNTIEKETRFYDSIYCRIDSSITYSGTLPIDPEFYEKYVYEYDGLKEVIRFFRYQDGNWVYVGRVERERNSSGKIINSWTNLSDFALEEQRILEYDQNGNRVREKYFVKLRKEHELRLISDLKILYIYDDTAQLIKVTHDNTWYDYWTGEVESETTGEEQFSYYCDGLLRSEKGFGEYAPETETKYFYQTGVDCAESGDEPAVVAFPNPANDKIFIFSEALLYEDNWVSLYDAMGRMIYNERLGERTDRHEIDLNNLPAGIYFLKITWPENEVSRKIIKG